MNLEAPEAKNFLLELYNMTSGDTSAQVSMFDVGESVGMDKTEAGAMAEELIVQGWADIVTLSGGIGITAQGIEALQLEGVPVSVQGGASPLGTAPVIDNNARQTVEQMLSVVRTDCMQHGSTAFEDMEEMVIDIKTIETQLLSPAPKTAVIREVFRSLNSTLNRIGISNSADQIEAMLKA